MCSMICQSINLCIIKMKKKNSEFEVKMADKISKNQRNIFKSPNEKDAGQKEAKAASKKDVRAEKKSIC